MKGHIYIYIFFAILLIGCSNPAPTPPASTSDPSGAVTDDGEDGESASGKAPGVQLSYADAAPSRIVTAGPFIHPLGRTSVSDDEGTVTYTSSDPSVARVDEDSGEVTIVAEGETTITATKAATDKYEAHTAEYELTVTPLPAGKQLSYKVSRVQKYHGDGSFTVQLDVSDVPGDKGKITYESTNPSVATVNRETGEVTITLTDSAESTTIIATKAATERYTKSTARYELVVFPPLPTL